MMPNGELLPPRSWLMSLTSVTHEAIVLFDAADVDVVVAARDGLDVVWNECVPE
jgi:hypothetical protein